MRLIIILSLLFSGQILAVEKPGREKLLSLAAGEWVAKSLYAAAELDIAKPLSKGAKSVSELALLTGCDEESLYRLLRLLASEGVFHEEENHFFSNNESSALLADSEVGSLRSLMLFYSEEMSTSWQKLSSCLKNKKPAFDLTFGCPVFTYFRDHPLAAARFNAAMREKSKAVISSCLHAVDFGVYSSVYDIGGGMGHFLQAILAKNPQAKGALYDLPEVIKAAENSFASLKDRCALLSGDFFQNVPKGGDAYLMKSILHDWSDADAVKLLKKCHESMPDDGTLLVVEPIVTDPNQREFAKMMDVYMMVITGGKERTMDDFSKLLAEAGFYIMSVTSTDTEFCILKCRKR